MTQYVINIGAIPNDGTGDPLRTAFNETNLNFDQIFAAGPVLSNIQIANNTILTLNTNGNLVLAPNGTGVVQSNVSIVPNLANIRNLGSSTQRWATVYTQYLNVSSGTSVNGNLTVDGNLIVMGNVVNMGNIVTDTLTIQLANTTTTANAADGAGITVGANDDIATMLYNSAGNVWAMNIGLNTPNLVVNNISSDDSTFVTVQDGLDIQGDVTAETLSVAGNITGNYILGNISQASGFPETYSNSNVATFLSAFGSNTISTTGNVTVGNILPAGYVSAAGNVRGANFGTVGTVSATGNVTGNFFIGNGSQLTGLSTNSISNGNSNVEIATANGNVSITASGTEIWTFNNTGNLTLPANGDINFDGGGITQTINEDLNIVVQDEEDDGWSLYNTITDSIGNNLSQTQLDSSSFTIRTDMTGASHQWQFDGNTLQVSTNSTVRGFDSNVVVQSMFGANGGTASLQSVSNVNDPNVFSTFDATTTSANIKIYNGGSNGGTEYAWQFDNAGNLSLPRGGIVYETNIPFGGLSGNTIALAPSGGTSADQQLLVYPTAGPDANHLHLTSGNLYNTELFLGNDNLYVKLANTGNVVVNSNDDTGNTAQWTFGTNGIATLPGEGILQSINDTVTLSSLNTTTGNANSVYLGSSGGLGFNDQEIGGNWLEIFRNGTEPEIRVPVGLGNLNIQTASGNTPYNWTFDDTGNLTVPGNIVMPPGSSLVGNGASPAPSISGFSNGEFGGNVSVIGNVSASNISASGNITGNTAGYAIGYRDIPQVSFTGNATIATTDAGKHFYSTQSTNYTLTIANNASQDFQVGAAITIVNQGTGNITVAQGSGVTLYLAGNATSGNRTVSTFGMATIMKVATDTWFINGTGVS